MRAPEPVDLPKEEGPEGGEIIRCGVGHGALELGPDELVGVELRGVAGKALHMEPRMALPEALDQPTLVGAAWPRRLSRLALRFEA